MPAPNAGHTNGSKSCLAATALEGAPVQGPRPCAPGASADVRLEGTRILIVHYGEHTPLDENYRAIRMGHLAKDLTDARATVVRYVPSYSMHSRRQRPPGWSNQITTEGMVRIIPTRSFASSVSGDRAGFLWDFATGTASALRDDGPFDVVVTGYPPPGLVLSIRRATKGTTPILADIRDLWPDALVPSGRPVLTGLAQRIGVLLAQELRLASGVVAMSPTMLERAPRSRRRRTITTGIPEQDPVPEAPSEAPDPNRPWKAIFVGSFAQLFDFDSVIEGWRQFIATAATPKPTLELHGDGGRRAEVVGLIAGLEGVTYGGGWLPSPQVPSRLAAADVGLAPTRPGVGTTLSNKVLEYLAGGLYVLHSLEGPIASDLDDAHLGRCVASSPAGWAAAFADVHENWQDLRPQRRSRRNRARACYGQDVVRERWFDEIAALLLPRPTPPST